MNDISKSIGWATRSLNPVVGCTFGCPYCYARRMNSRFHYVPDFSKPQFFPERLAQLSEKKPQIIFMDSMSDIADWKPEWTQQVFDAMKANPQHKYLFLSKRLDEFFDELYAADVKSEENWLFGKSICTRDQMKKQFYAKFYPDFLSIEPILERIDLMLLPDTKWVIVGAQTGPGSSEHQPERGWIESILEKCREEGIPLFMKGSLAKVWGVPLIQEFPW